MLSFLKGLELKNLPIGAFVSNMKTSALNLLNHKNAKENSIPGMDAHPQQPSTAAQREKQVLESTVIFGTLFALSLFCLLFMIKKTSPQSAFATQINIEEARLDMAIARLTEANAETFNGANKIAERFYELANVQQISANELIKNPFTTEETWPNTQENTEGEFEILPGMMQRIAIMEQANNMQLLSIIATDSVNCCMIDYKFLYEGDYIRGFKIVKIADTHVVLEWKPQKNRKDSTVQPEAMKVILRLSE